MVNFAARGGFRSGLAFSQPILQLQNEGGGLRNGGAAAKMGVLGVEDFVEHFAAAKLRGRGYEMALMCQEGVLQL